MSYSWAVWWNLRLRCWRWLTNETLAGIAQETSPFSRVRNTQMSRAMPANMPVIIVTGHDHHSGSIARPKMGLGMRAAGELP